MGEINLGIWYKQRVWRFMNWCRKNMKVLDRKIKEEERKIAQMGED